MTIYQYLLVIGRHLEKNRDSEIGFWFPTPITDLTDNCV